MLRRMLLLLTLCLVSFAQSPSRGYTIPVIDLANETQRQVIVDREPGQYLGHPTTVLLEDNKTIITVYPKGHGKGAIQMKRSTDGGKTWSARLPTPKSWETSLETPTIHRVIDKRGKKRLIIFSGLYPIRSSISEDDGKTWSELKPIGDYGGIVAMGAVERLRNGDYVALFHDDGRFFRQDGKRSPVMTLYQTFSRDGGLTWSEPQELFKSEQIHLCEPGLIRSPDGKQIAMLLRENRRKQNSHVMFTNDECKTWSAPRELPGALTGDRHTGKYAPDGRLFISFRDTTLESKTNGDWVAWVGRYEDIVNNREGQYRVRLMKNYKNASGWNADCAYPGVEVLRDGTFVTTTYGHWVEGELPYVVSVRLKLKELDTKARQRQPLKYVVFHNETQGNPNSLQYSRRDIKILMDERAFEESNLLHLCKMISAKYPIPINLFISIYTHFDQISAPDVAQLSDGPDDPEAEKHHRAAFVRRPNFGETIAFTINPPSKERKIIKLSGPSK